MEDEVSSTSSTNLKKRNSLNGRLWKQLRLSARKPKSKEKSFVSYCANDGQPQSEESYISAPTNFERREFDTENVSLSHISIQECPFDVTGYGRLIMKDVFKLRRPKRKKLTVFLFEKIIIFTRCQKNEDVYYYFGSIKISNLSLAPPSHNPTKILLKDFVNSKLTRKDIEFKLEAKTEEVQKSWRDALKKCLWQQLLNAKGT